MRSKRYNRLMCSARWIRLRKLILQEDALCQDCKKIGKITLARQLHHIKPIESAVNDDEAYRLCFDRNNIVQLCIPCHILRHKQLGSSTVKTIQTRVNNNVENFKFKFL